MLRVLDSVTVPFKWDPVQLFYSQLIFRRTQCIVEGLTVFMLAKNVASLRICKLYGIIGQNQIHDSRLLLFSKHVTLSTMKHSPFHSVEDSRTVVVCT